MLTFRVLGTIDLRDAERRPVDAVLAQPKRLALLAYLAAARPHGFHRRDTLVGLFWPDLDQGRARNALSQALHHLRRSLGSDVIETRGDEEVGISESEIECDARQLWTALGDERADLLESLYRGDLLPGLFVPGAPEFERWLDEERRALRARAASAAWRFADASIDSEAAGAAAWARFAASLSPDDEASQRRLIATLARVGDRAGALRTFDELTRALAREYDAEPSAETIALAQQVRASTVRKPASYERQLTASIGSPEAGQKPEFRTTVMMTSPPDIRRRRRVLPIALLAIVVALATTFYVLRGRASSVLGGAPSVAVMPFLDLTPGHGAEYLSDGMAEELSDALSRVPGLRVTSRTSAFAYKGRAADAREIGRALGVETLVEGSLRLEHNTLRVTAQLIDARSGYHRWSRTFDRELADVFSVQDEIARAIVNELVPRLSARVATSSVPPRHSTTNLSAYTWYLQGRFFWNQRTAPALRRAVAFFDSAAVEDTTYAPTFAGLADAYDVMAALGYVEPRQAFAKAKTAAVRALSLDSTLAEPHAALGFVYLFNEWNAPAASRELDAALAIDPNYSAARLYRAFLLVSRGRADEAVAEIRRAQLSDPLSRIINARVGFVLAMAHRFGEAIVASQHAIALDSTNGTAYWSLGDGYTGTREFARAASSYERARGLTGLWLGNEGYSYAVGGEVERARAFLARLDSVARTTYVDPYERAAVYAGLGDRDAALRWLTVAKDEHSAAFIWIRAEPMFDRLRNDPRFDALLRSLNL